MTALDHRTHAIAAETRTVAAVARVAGALRSFLRAVANRRQVNRLGNLSDHELADIGLTRSDLHVVVDLPFGRDPTVHLGPLAEIRRREIEAAARQSC